MKPELIRLNKYLANIGIASRRQVEKMLSRGDIKINGEIINKQGVKINPQKDKVEVNNKLISHKQSLVYIIFNKPKAVISTAKDTHHRLKVTDFINLNTRVYPVGRLDKDTQGLILLTNDGQLTYQLTHPKYHVAKTYEVKVLGKINRAILHHFENGIELEDGKTAPAEVEVITKTNHDTTLKITIYEGKKRQIRRMCASLHLYILSLKRIAIGKLQLGNLKEGKWRHLSQQEIKLLKNLK